MQSDSKAEGVKLSRGETWFCLAVSTGVFLLWQGPIWKHRWHVDTSVFWSYLVIPPVIGAVLLWRKKWAAGALVVGSMEVMVWKFAATYVIAHTIWMLSDPPAPKVPPTVELPPIAEEAPTVPTPIAQDEKGVIEGSVAITDGSRVAVFVASGLDRYTFAPPAARPSFAVGTSIEPSLAVVELHQGIDAHSADGRLHTLIAAMGDSDLFNIPLQASGAPSGATVDRGLGVAKMRCAVHERSGELGMLVIVANPFHAVLDAGGRFRFDGVPAGSMVMEAITSDGRHTRTAIDVAAGGIARVELQIAER